MADQVKMDSTIVALENFKKFMMKLELEFWIVCGTLLGMYFGRYWVLFNDINIIIIIIFTLGWYRQCHITPYTTDIDFATWSRYISYINDADSTATITKHLKAEAYKHILQLYIRFGHSNHSLEYSFMTIPANKTIPSEKFIFSI